MKKRFDVIVIGAGSGLTFSSLAAEQGKKVAIVETGPFGGTCLNRGCIPSKMLIHSANVADTIRGSSQFGISSKITNVNWSKIVNRVNSMVDDNAKKIESANRRHKNITIFKERARFVNYKELQVGKDTIVADKIFICAGTRPFVPPIPGLESVPFITSNEALRLKKQPKKLTIIGGGYIGTELAHFFGSLGAKVTIIDRNKVLMKAEDSDIAKRITKVYDREHNLVLNATIKQVRRVGKNIGVDVVASRKKKTIVGDTLLVATGRHSNADILNVDATDVKINKRGFVKVNSHMETNVPGIWAIGDIVGVYMFKHSANWEATCVAENVFGRGKKKRVDYTAMPHAAFTSPQVASVGATEEQLIEKKVKYVKATYDFINTGYGKALEDSDGFVKILASPTGKILGCHIIGSQASILIHEVIVAMKHNLGVKGLLDAVHVHPALSEVVSRAFEALDL